MEKYGKYGKYPKYPRRRNRRSRRQLTTQIAQTAQTARRSSKRNVSRSPRSPRRSRRSPFPRKPMHGGVSDREENYARYERETDGGFYDKKHYLTYIKLADASYNALYVACRNLGASPQLAATVAQSKFVRWSEEEMQILFAKAFAQLIQKLRSIFILTNDGLEQETYGSGGTNCGFLHHEMTQILLKTRSGKNFPAF